MSFDIFYIFVMMLHLKWTMFRGTKYVCLLIWGFSSPSKSCHYEDVTITSKKLQILTYIRNSWPLSSEGGTSTVTREICL